MLWLAWNSCFVRSALLSTSKCLNMACAPRFWRITSGIAHQEKMHDIWWYNQESTEGAVGDCFHNMTLKRCGSDLGALPLRSSLEDHSSISTSFPGLHHSQPQLLAPRTSLRSVDSQKRPARDKLGLCNSNHEKGICSKTMQNKQTYCRINSGNNAAPALTTTQRQVLSTTPQVPKTPMFLEGLEWVSDESWDAPTPWSPCCCSQSSTSQTPQLRLERNQTPTSKLHCVTFKDSLGLEGPWRHFLAITTSLAYSESH